MGPPDEYVSLSYNCKCGNLSSIEVQYRDPDRMYVWLTRCQKYNQSEEYI